MYAAKKYMIPKLVEICRSNLEGIINESNACYLLEQSLVFCEEQLAAKFVNVIAELSDKLLLEKKLLSASRQAVETVLVSNELRSRESLVYEFCLQWAKEQLLIHQGIQNPTDEQIRETLGGLVYLIRFPIMDSEEFGELVGQRNILNSEEKLLLYYYLTTRNGVDQLTFCAQKRNFFSSWDEEFCVDRVVKCAHGIWGGNTDAIDFLTGDDVVLTGVGLYSGYSTDYVAQIEVIEHGNTVYSDTVTVPLTGNSAPYKISLSAPIIMRTFAKYSLIVTRPGNDIIGYYAGECRKTCMQINHRIVNFYECSQRHIRKRSYTTELFGQIPRLYFKD